MSPDSILVLYTSKYGSTKQYAEWIGSSLSALVQSLDEAGELALRVAKTMVIGGSVRMGKITCADFILRHWKILKDKRIILFSVSGTPPENPAVQRYFEGSLPADIRSLIRFFPLPGRHTPLDFGDRFLVWFPKTVLRFRMWLARTPEARHAAAVEFRMLDQLSDHVDRSRIAPILACCGS